MRNTDFVVTYEWDKRPLNDLLSGVQVFIFLIGTKKFSALFAR
jgi:hypothetical protein